MRTLVIGDVHGCLTALTTLIESVDLAADDRLIFLGDYVDRGPDSRGVLDRLIRWHDEGRLVALRGNHDQMMLDSREDRLLRSSWLRCGGRETLQSYGHRAIDRDFVHISERHWRFLRDDCRLWYETPSHLFVHGSLDPDLPMAEQDLDVLLWEKIDGPVAHRSGKTVVCGHTRQDSGLPLDHGTLICIDTGVYLPDGWLTGLHLETGDYYQANQAGATRRGNLADLAVFGFELTDPSDDPV